MFGVDTSELLVVAVLALLFIGPKELPAVMMKVGRMIGRVRGYARHFTSGIEEVIRQAELEEMEKKWREENERIMREYPTVEAQMADADAPVMMPGMTPAPLEEGSQADVPPEQRELP